MQRTIERTVTIWGDDITSYETNSLRKSFEALLTKDLDSLITFQIMSGGGRCDAGFALFDWLKANVPNLQTVAYGGVNSMAVILFAAGNHRVATKHSSFFLHPVASSFESKTTLNETGHKNAVASLKVTQEHYINVLLGITNQNKKALEKLIKEETTLFPAQALEMGLVHEIV